MNFTKITNEDLYQMCLRGDESAWEYVYNYVLVIARSPRWYLQDTPEDMAQSIVCHLLSKGIEQVRKQSAFRAYIKRVAVNLILDSFRKKKIVSRSLDSSDYSDNQPYFDPPSNNPGPEEMTFGKEFLQKINSAMRDLSENCRDTLYAYIDYKMGGCDSYKTLADKLGKSIGTLSSLIKRCLDKLRMVEEIRVWLKS